MSFVISRALLAEFSHFIMNEMGLYFSEQKLKDLERGIKAASRSFEFENVESCIHWLMSSSLNQRQIEVLADALTVGETYFFRDKKMFRALEEIILPQLIYQRYRDNQKRLRIWSAGCASGEEAYSIAIVIHKLIPDLKNWNISLLSTDINIESLKKLSSGIYSEWSFRGVDEEIKRTWFKELEKGRYEILPAIRNMVEPFYLNLAGNTYPSLMNNTNALDVIFCRNVLMYFSDQLSEKVIKHFYDCLVNHGCLIVSAGEAPQPYFSCFKKDIINGVTLFKREDQKIPVPLPLPSPLPVRISIPEPAVREAPAQTTIDYKKMAQESANEGKLQDALSWSDKAISENKTSADLHYMQAMILLELDKLNEAAASLKRVLYLDPNYVLAYVMLGNVLKKQKNTAEARKQFENALGVLSGLDPSELAGDITVGRLIDVITTMNDVSKDE